MLRPITAVVIQERPLCRYLLGTSTLFPRRKFQRQSIKVSDYVICQDWCPYHTNARNGHALRGILLRQGMKEHDLRKTVEATIFARMLYAYPCLQLGKSQTARLEATLRKCLRTNLGIPRRTPKFLINEIKLCNRLYELKSAYLVAQHDRLSTWNLGRIILNELGCHTSTHPLIPPTHLA